MKKDDNKLILINIYVNISKHKQLNINISIS